MGIPEALFGIDLTSTQAIRPFMITTVINVKSGIRVSTKIAMHYGILK